MSRRSHARRRQRSLRVVVAAVLIATATVVVLVAMLLGSVTALSVAAVLSVVCGAAATRIVHAEMVQDRRERARDRASHARQFRTLFVDQAAQHAAFATAMRERLAGREREVRELDATLRLSERRATDAEERARHQRRRADEARHRVTELEVALAIRTAEEADELASWSPAGDADVDTVVDLLAWNRASASGA